MPYCLITALGVQVLQGGKRSLQCTSALVGFSVIASVASDMQLNGLQCSTLGWKIMELEVVVLATKSM